MPIKRKSKKPQPAEIRIKVQCENDPNHAKILRLHGEAGLDYAHRLGRLLDGTSALYIYPPGPDSPIGRCAICRGTLSYEVEERECQNLNLETIPLEKIST